MPKEKTKRENKEIKVTKKNIDKFIVNGEKLIYIPTGEVIDNFFTTYDYIHLMQESENEKEIPKEFFYNEWLKSKKFTKFYQVEVRNYHNKMSLQAQGLLFILMTHLRKSSNEVVISNKRPTNKVLLDYTGVGIKLLNKLLSELEELNLIKRIGNTNKRAILVNPYLCFNGKNAVKSTVKLFYPKHE